MSIGIITLQARQRAMSEFISANKDYRFMAIGRTTPWTDESNPPTPSQSMTSVEELIGLQRVDFYKYAKVIANPTALQKRVGIYYKGLYYSVTQDQSIALAEGYTDVMVGITFDRDAISAIPVGVQYRQIGLYDSVNATADEIKYGITASQWALKSASDKGILVTVENRAVITRQNDAREVVYCLISF